MMVCANFSNFFPVKVGGSTLVFTQKSANAHVSFRDRRECSGRGGVDVDRRALVDDTARGGGRGLNPSDYAASLIL